MEYADYMRFAFALMFVVGLIGGTAILARRFGFAPGAATGGRATQKRLEIVENLALDPKRRLLIIRRDNAEHLILLGGETETIIETNIARQAQLPAQTDATPAEEPYEQPSADDDVFARLRKVAELMNEKRALSLRTGRKPHEAAANPTLPRPKIAGDRR
ncbi:flagellar biosynthetic protein FliO [Pyruvatibacter sp.]|uniref:FliO/MopB family protein n=1 Tax=Pyruvatibacter sp. TaxID=1981328 RepID=UPI0032EC07E9